MSKKTRTIVINPHHCECERTSFGKYDLILIEYGNGVQNKRVRIKLDLSWMGALASRQWKMLKSFDEDIERTKAYMRGNE